MHISSRIFASLLYATSLALLGSCLVGFAPTASAQDPADPPVRPQGSVSFLVGIPQGEFRDNVDNPGFGVDFFGGLGIGQSPVVLGLDVGFLIYGRERRTENFSPDIPEVQVEVQTTNNIVQSHFVLRIQPPEGSIRPYADALVGFKYLFTQSEINSERFDDDDPIARSTNFDDFALSYGIGGGIDIDVYRPGPDKKTELSAVAIRIGAQYLLGSEADYLQEGSIRRTNGSLTFDVDRSRTTFLEPYLGVSVHF